MRGVQRSVVNRRYIKGNLEDLWLQPKSEIVICGVEDGIC